MTIGMMEFGATRLPPLTNELARSYDSGSPERAAVKVVLAAMSRIKRLYPADYRRSRCAIAQVLFSSEFALGVGFWVWVDGRAVAPHEAFSWAQRRIRREWKVLAKTDGACQFSLRAGVRHCNLPARWTVQPAPVPEL